MKIAISEFCLLCDDDIVLDKNDCLERMVDEYMLCKKAKTLKSKNAKMDTQDSQFTSE